MDEVSDTRRLKESLERPLQQTHSPLTPSLCCPYVSGGGTNNHVGNVEFRKLVEKAKPEYVRAAKKGKSDIGRAIVRAVQGRSPPGRFLTHSTSGQWVEIDDRKALGKTCQALREGAPEIRQKQDSMDKPAASLATQAQIKRFALPRVHCLKARADVDFAAFAAAAPAALLLPLKRR